MDDVSASEREIRKEMLEHPWASREIAERIALDHKKRPKTNTPEGKKLYQRNFMRLKRGSTILLEGLPKQDRRRQRK